MKKGKILKIFTLVNILIILTNIIPTYCIAQTSTDATDFEKEFEIVKSHRIINKTEVSETELYLDLIKKSDEELISIGYSMKKIEELRNFDVKKELKKRASLKNDQLYVMGYNEDQVKNLKTNTASLEYDSTKTLMENNIEAIEAMEALSLIAKCAVGIGCAAASALRIRASVYYEWNTFPLFMQYDMLVVAWDATKENGSPMNVAYNRYPSYFVIGYYDGYTGSYNYSENIWWADDLDPYRTVNTGMFDIGVDINFAKRGYGYVEVELTSSTSDLIGEVLFKAVYAHTILSVELEYEVGSGLSITFSTSVTESGCSARIANNGYIRDYYSYK